MPSKKWSNFPKRTEKCVAAMMVKNEAEQIRETTLNSIKDYIGHLIIYDTGSTDGTQQVINEWCKLNDIRCDLKEGKFVDFAVSRNVLMDFCDELLTGQDDVWILQLDAHDVLQGGEKLVEFVENYKGTHTGAYATQKWLTGANLDSYYNVRLVRPHFKWRYNLDAVVHEYQLPPSIELEGKPHHEIIFRPEGIVLYQDRTSQGDASFRRFTRDKEMLYAKHLQKPKEPRTLFYLAQTCSCLGACEEAYKYYLLRLKEVGFIEEIYQSFFRLGELSATLKHDWEETMMWYIKAFQHSQRAEPLVKIAEYYQNHNFQGDNIPDWPSCYMYSNMASQLIYPINQILFVDSATYTYKRHHLLGMSAYYVGRYKEGKEACLKAIEARNLDIDKNNLKCYLEKELEILHTNQMSCPCLFAATMADREIRTKDEMDIKHDKCKALEEMMDVVVSETRKNNKNISNHVLDAWKNYNKTTKIPVIPTQQNMTSVPTSKLTIDDVSTIANLPRKDRRAKMRQMLNDKKKQQKLLKG